MRILVWQWGRRGSGPRFAACLADSLRDRPGIDVSLSLCRNAEIMEGPDAPRCEMPVRTYGGLASFVVRLVTAPVAVPLLLLRLRRIRPELAICAMPGPPRLLFFGRLLPYKGLDLLAAAIAAGRPVIATQVGGLPEQLSGTPQAVLCAPESASLARAIGRWLEAPFQIGPSTDGVEVWRQAASGLLLAIGAALPPQQAQGDAIPGVAD